MTRRRQNHRKLKFYNTPDLSEKQTTTVAPLTFGKALKWLWATILFRLKPSDYLNKKVLYRGKYYRIKGETLDYFFIAEFPKQAFPKVGNKFKIR